MIKPTYDWQLLTGFSDELFIKIAKKEGVDPVAAKLLYERGIHSAEELHTLLKPRLEELHDPYLLHDMDKEV
ncbi:hypothetical protein ACJBW9_11120, partial [Streptococcus suis]